MKYTKKEPTFKEWYECIYLKEHPELKNWGRGRKKSHWKRKCSSAPKWLINLRLNTGYREEDWFIDID